MAPPRRRPARILAFPGALAAAAAASLLIVVLNRTDPEPMPPKGPVVPEEPVAVVPAVESG